jgi:endonuclease/exonuclease/phosphatase family metal-dependent hydrolase
MFGTQIHKLGSPAILCRWVAVCLLGLCSVVPSYGQTSTFIDRHLPTDLRVMTYNILWDSIFPDKDATKAAKFSRVLNAINPDVLNLQEIGDPFTDGWVPKTAFDVRNLLNNIAPLDGGGSWSVYKGGSGDSVIASKYPLSMTRNRTNPNGDLQLAMALVDLPDDQFPTDFYLMNNHYNCCGSSTSDEEDRRVRQSDANVNWLRDARTPGGSINLAPGTPFAVVGDLNTVSGSFQPLNALLTGNIINEGTYGSDSPPDWDGTNLTDGRPYQNGNLLDDYTYRSSNTNKKRFDYIIYSDSNLDVGNKFVLNTYDMTPAQQTATGLQRFDTAQGNSSTSYDHLPVVVDFRLFDFADSDFNFSRTVDNADLTAWQNGYGIANGATRAQGDANGDGRVDGRDFLVWQQQYTAAAPTFVSVPEPGTLALFSCSLLFVARLLDAVRPRRSTANC